MKRTVYLVSAMAVGFLIGFAVFSSRGDDGVGHANTNLHFAVDAAVKRTQKGSPQDRLNALLTVDVRHVNSGLKAAYYTYVASVAEECKAWKEKRDTALFSRRSSEAYIAFQSFEKE
jgi:hypothetical protein